MDYRKPAVFGENWSPSRYQVLPYFAEERAYLRQGGVQRILDLGCAAGWNMSRFRQYERHPVGVDVAPERVIHALKYGPVAVASGLALPFRDEVFDCVYIQHVLHHIGDLERALTEARRCLKENGLLFLIETVEDNALIRWGRGIHSNWMGDEINVRFDFDGLKKVVSDNGFELVRYDQYSVIFWLWEVLPDQIPALEKLTPIFVKVEQAINRFAHGSGAHCYVVALKSGI